MGFAPTGHRPIKSRHVYQTGDNKSYLRSSPQIWRFYHPVVAKYIVRVLKSPYLRIGTQITNLFPVMIKNKTFWTPSAHVKVTFSLYLKRISESFECFLPGVGYYLWQNPTVDQSNSFIFNIQLKLTKFDLGAQHPSFNVILSPF